MAFDIDIEIEIEMMAKFAKIKVLFAKTNYIQLKLLFHFFSW